MSGDITGYQALITSQHADKPNFMASLAALVQPLADIQAMMASLPDRFDLDKALGAQLDAVGQWVGRNRYLSVPLTDVYFSLGVEGLGFGQGTWHGPYDPLTGLTALPDDAYRTLLRATIAANRWDGTIPGAYTAWEALFDSAGYQVLIQDNGDMTMLFGLVGPSPDAVTLGLLTGGYLSLKPAGVRITAYALPTMPNVPFFGFGIAGTNIAGFGSGCFASMIAPTI